MNKMEKSVQTFKQFINEEEHIVIDVDPEYTIATMEKANEDLDAVTAEPFVNSALFVNAVRGTLERYGVILPAHSNMQQLSMEGEWVYQLGDSGHYVYMVHNLTPEGSVEGYAQIVDQEELDELAELGIPETVEPEPEDRTEPTEWMKYPKARRDDDSGNTNEYA
jgi:hypothetical protein